MPEISASEQSLAGSALANRRWAFEPDRAAATRPGRDAFMAGFERKVDPDNKLDPAERARRAQSLRKSHFQLLALKSAQARRKAKGGPDAAA